MEEIFVQLSLVITIVLAISFIMRALRQPLIIGYIISGILVGPFFLNMISTSDTLKLFADFGIAFLLFIVGLNLSPKVIKDVGKISLIAGLGQVLFTAIIGYFIAVVLGFPVLTSIYIAIALTFSSTIIITKLLSDKGDLDSLYGKISIGILLVQDLIAILVLITISSLSNSSNLILSIGTTLLKGLLLLALIIPISIFVLPKAQIFFAKSQEFLFVFSIAWGLGLASLFHQAGLSLEVGALIAGVVLSASPYSFEISSKLKPLRDFFTISFFIFVGSNMVLNSFSEMIIPALILSIFVLIGKPLIVMILMGFFGYKKRTGFMSGLTVAQISEFSLIVVGVGVEIGHLSTEILSFVTLIGLFTIAGSTYMVNYSNKIYPKIFEYLSIFERKNLREKDSEIKKNHEALLFGYNRIGFRVLISIKKLKMNYLVVDINPETIKNLHELGIPSLYGDVYDKELLNEMSLDKVKIVISTVPDYQANALLIRSVKEVNQDAVIIVRAKDAKEAFALYNKGANYVLTPYFLGGEHVANMIDDFKFNPEMYKKEKEKHMKLLEEVFKKNKKSSLEED